MICPSMLRQSQRVHGGLCCMHRHPRLSERASRPMPSTEASGAQVFRVPACPCRILVGGWISSRCLPPGSPWLPTLTARRDPQHLTASASEACPCAISDCSPASTVHASGISVHSCSRTSCRTANLGQDTHVPQRPPTHKFLFEAWIAPRLLASHMSACRLTTGSTKIWGRTATRCSLHLGVRSLVQGHVPLRSQCHQPC